MRASVSRSGFRHPRLASQMRVVNAPVYQALRPPLRPNARYLNGWGFSGAPTAASSASQLSPLRTRTPLDVTNAKLAADNLLAFADTGEIGNYDNAVLAIDMIGDPFLPSKEQPWAASMKTLLSEDGILLIQALQTLGDPFYKDYPDEIEAAKTAIEMVRRDLEKVSRDAMPWEELRRPLSRTDEVLSQAGPVKFKSYDPGFSDWLNLTVSAAHEVYVRPIGDAARTILTSIKNGANAAVGASKTVGEIALFAVAGFLIYSVARMLGR